MVRILQQCRMFSRYLAQQLKTRFENLSIQVIDELDAVARPAPALWRRTVAVSLAPRCIQIISPARSS